MVGQGRPQGAEVLNLMEKDGVVDPADGPKAREIFKRLDWLSQAEEALR